MVQAAGRWQLPGLPSTAASCTAAVPLHLVCIQDSCATVAASGSAPSDGAAGMACPPTVLGVGYLLLSWPAGSDATDCGSNREQPCCTPPPACAVARRPLQHEPLRCCRLVSPTTGAEVGSISLAARLVELPPSAPAASQPQQPPPSQPAPAVPPAPHQPSQASEPSSNSPRRQPQWRKMRSTGVQASPCAAGRQPSIQPPAQQQPACGPAPLLFMLPTVCMAGTAVPGAWCAVQGAPMLVPAAVPVLGVPVQPPLPAALLPACGAAAWGIAAAAHERPLARPIAGFQLPSGIPAPAELPAAPAAPATDPLAPTVAAIRARVAQQAARQQLSVPLAAACLPAVAEDIQPLCTLRSPLKAADRAPPLQHHLREASSPRRQVGCNCSAMLLRSQGVAADLKLKLKGALCASYLLHTSSFTPQPSSRCTSPVKRHEAMAASALGRPPSSRGGRPASAGGLSGTAAQFCCPGCLEPFLRLPGSPTKRPQSGQMAAAAVRQTRIERSSGCCPHCGVPGKQPERAEQQVAPPQQAQQQAPEAEAKPGGNSSSGTCSAQQSSSRAACGPDFEQLLLQLNLGSSDWRGLLMRSLRGALEAQGSDAASEAAIAPAGSAAASGAPAAQQAAQRAAQQAAQQVAPAGAAREAELVGGRLKGKAVQAGSLPASPRITAGRPSTATAPGVLPVAAAAGAGGSSTRAAAARVVQHGVAGLNAYTAQPAADTMRQVVNTNRELIRWQLAAAERGQGVRQQEQGGGSVGGEETAGPAGVAPAAADNAGPAAQPAGRSPVPVPASIADGQQMESADDIVARLQCHQHSFSSSSSDGGGGGSVASSYGRTRQTGQEQLQHGVYIEPLSDAQPSQSTLVSFGSEWERPVGMSGGGHGDGVEGAAPLGGSSGSGSESYEDDFEPE